MGGGLAPLATLVPTSTKTVDCFLAPRSEIKTKARQGMLKLVSNTYTIKNVLGKTVPNSMCAIEILKPTSRSSGRAFVFGAVGLKLQCYLRLTTAVAPL